MNGYAREYRYYWFAPKRSDINETGSPQAAEEGADQLAQSTGEGQPIGQVETTTGTVTVTHVDGTTSTSRGVITTTTHRVSCRPATFNWRTTAGWR